MDTRDKRAIPLQLFSKTLALIVFCIGISPISWAQAMDMFEPDTMTADTVKSQADQLLSNKIDKLVNQPDVTAFEAVRLRQGVINSAKVSDTINVNVFGKDIVLIVQDIRSQGSDGVVWYASNPDTGDNMTLFVSGSRMAGSVREGKNLYSIQSLDNSLTGIIQVDDSKFQEHDEQHPEGAIEPYSEDSSSQQNDGLNVLADTRDVIRVMVAYTPAANAAVSDINATIALAVAETNQSYLNSGITTSIELAHSYQTSYTETGNMVTDLARIRTPNDGFMDEAHGLRNTYAADIVILMGSNSYGYCGLASTIMANQATAFAAVRIGCATGNYSFGHEIGHLQGARHIITRDPSTTPFAYGHGYCQPGVSFGWRTVMAYGCPNGDGTRIPYWSNPYRTYGGVAMGVVGESNNARVLNETAQVVANFRSSVVSTPWTIGFDWYCDGSYSKTTFNLDSDGTFTTGSYSGTWWESHNSVVMTFSSGTKYVGRHQGNSMTGKMATTGTLNGCWYGHPNDGFNYDPLLDAVNQSVIPENMDEAGSFN